MAAKPHTNGAIQDDYRTPFFKYEYHREKFPGVTRVALGGIKLIPGTDYDGFPLTNIGGKCLAEVEDREVGTREVGEDLIVNCSPTKLRRLIEIGIKQGKIVDGIDLDINHIGFIGSTNAMDFEVIPHATVSATTAAADSEPAPF